jgi:site-specific DNA-methyltransferase (adenine-specific)
LVLDPFNGSGTTGIACLRRRRNYVGIEMSTEYLDLSVKRIAAEIDKMENGPLTCPNHSTASKKQPE